MLSPTQVRKRTAAVSKIPLNAPNADVSPQSKIGLAVQDASGVLQGKTQGGISLNQTCRTDGALWKQQMAACLERAQTAKSPSLRMQFEAAYNRLKLCEDLKNGKR
jgi:hypothetical protein